MVAFVYMFLSEKIGNRILVMCPKTVLTNWCSEFAKWTRMAAIEKPMCHLFSDKVKAKDRILLLRQWHDDGGVLFINYEMYSNLVHKMGNSKMNNDNNNTKKKKKKNGYEEEEVSDANIDEEEYNNDEAMDSLFEKNNESKLSDMGEATKLMLQADLLIMDEGHRLKNEKTKLFKTMSKIITRNRIVLTGTPLQNKVSIATVIFLTHNLK